MSEREREIRDARLTRVTVRLATLHKGKSQKRRCQNNLTAQARERQLTTTTPFFTRSDRRSTPTAHAPTDTHMHTKSTHKVLSRPVDFRNVTRSIAVPNMVLPHDAENDPQPMVSLLSESHLGAVFYLRLRTTLRRLTDRSSRPTQQRFGSAALN